MVSVIDLWKNNMKKNVRLIWYIYPSYLLIIVCSLLSMSLYVSSFLEDFYIERTGKDLLVRGRLLGNQIAGYLNPVDANKINQVCIASGKVSDTRITVILPEGQVIGDSLEAPFNMNNHKNRPEVLTALEGGTGIATRQSETLRIKMLYVALPVSIGDSIKAVLRISLPATEIDNTISKVQLRLLLAGILVAFLAALVCYYVSRRLSSPIEELKNGADLFASGRFDHRLYSPSILELAGLSDAMNRMAFQLAERILTEEAQKNEYGAVLSSMTEGVIGIDLDENIININKAARLMLGTGDENITGLGIQEIIRNQTFIRFVQRASEEEASLEDDFSLKNDEDSVINIRSMPLKNAENGRIGTLIVLNDVTHIRLLENIRKDFVANVSHEIKTPLTAIKGFIETIVMLEDESPDDARRFLKIVMKHVDRLDAILEDLLSLARIEQKSVRSGIETGNISLSEVAETVFQVVQSKADDRHISLEYDSSYSLRFEADARLLEQALVNLVDNAVKYSHENTTVSLTAEAIDGELVISVTDQGDGIPEKDLPRIFERFYRVDKARSRKLGGTGLGLAIVKHIVQAHGGKVSVGSVIGKGSVFKIHLPV